MEENKKIDLSIPAAIILAGMVIAGAIVYSNQSETNFKGRDNDSIPVNENKEQPSPEKVKPVSLEDHIYGSQNAPIKIIEFSDTECPFCKIFHPTLKKIVSDYNGKVAWVYRHFPLDSIHSKARKEAEATECAASLGGEEKFWAYLDRLFEITPSNNRLDLNLLPEIAAYVGIDKSEFLKCLNSGKYAKKVADNLEDAVNAGGRGTPYSIVIGPKGEKEIVSGAESYEYVKSVIDNLLK